jgi:uncharacterized Ntn-hydrolase superfamily protein
MTYSLVVRDPETGELGVAVQTCNFAVGRIVPWAEAGIGAVATQSFSDPGYGALGLELLRAGKTPEEMLAALRAADTQEAHRQVGVVDATGRSAAHTGGQCIREAGHVTRDGLSAQANMMRSAEVWPALAEAFAAASGTLAERLLAGLDAAEAAGGDFRGRQSAALLVVAGEPSGRLWQDRVCDVRVDDHPEPLAELRRLVALDETLRKLRTFRELAAFEDESERARGAGVSEQELAWAGAAAAARGGDEAEARRRIEPLAAAEPRWLDALESLLAAVRLEAEER